jgi:hypothetical protein
MGTITIIHDTILSLLFIWFIWFLIGWIKYVRECPPNVPKCNFVKMERKRE